MTRDVRKAIMEQWLFGVRWYYLDASGSSRKESALRKEVFRFLSCPSRDRRPITCRESAIIEAVRDCQWMGRKRRPISSYHSYYFASYVRCSSSFVNVAKGRPPIGTPAEHEPRSPVGLEEPLSAFGVGVKMLDCF